MIRICTTLAQAGYRVRLVGRERPDSEPLVDRAFEQKRLRCRFERGKLFYFEYNIRLFFYLLVAKFDAVCAVDLDTILPGLLVAKSRGEACIYDAHEYFTETPEVERRPAIKRIWEAVAAFAIPRVDAAYTVGEGLAEIFEQRYGKPFSVIRNVPFGQEAIAQPDPAKPPVILYQGVLNEGRGLEQVIRAMQQIKGAELWLVGEGDLSAALRQMVADLELESQIKFFGYLQPEALREVTLQASIGLNLLENRGLSYYYSLANKAFDYIQAGLPSIHMRFPEYEKINAEAGVFFLIDNLEVSTIISATQQLLQDASLYHKIRQNCLIARELYRWECEAANLVAIYKKIVG